MKIKMVWETALKSVIKNTRRTLLTMLGLVIGTGAVIMIVSIGRGYEKDQLQKMLPDSDGETIQTIIKFSPNDSSFEQSNLNYFSENDIDLIKQIEGVVDAKYEIEKPEKTYRNQDILLKKESIPVRSQLVYLENLSKKVTTGRALSESDLINRNKVILVSSELIKSTNTAPASWLGQAIELSGETFTIVGVFDSQFSETVKVYIPSTTYDHYWPGNSKRNVAITISNKYSSSNINEKVIDLLSNNGSSSSLGSYDQGTNMAMADSLSSLFQSLTLMISAVGGISLFISGVGVMNMIYTSVSERTKEIGIRRALGATKKTIQLQFLLEGLTLTLVGGIIGYFIGIFFAKLVSIFLGFNFIPDIFTAILAVSISVVIGLVFSYYPSKSATKKDIVKLVK